MSLKRPLAAVAVLASIALLAGCGDDEDSSPTSASEPNREGTGVSCDYPEDSMGEPARDVDAPPAEANVSGEVPITIATSIGDLHATLDAEATPCTVNSFVSLAEQQYFDDTTCHRLTTEGILVLQCGDPSATGMGGPGYSFPDELSGDETYPAGTLAMANAGPDTNGSQFFVVYGETPLPPSYTVFGTVDEDSIALVSDAAAAGVEGGGADGAPATPVEISTVTLD